MITQLVRSTICIIILVALTGCTGVMEGAISSIGTLLPTTPTPTTPPDGSGVPQNPGANQVAFEATFKTLTTSEVVTLPLRTDLGFTYDIVVDWGDNTFEEFKSTDGLPVTHTYSGSGDYNVRFWGQADALSFAVTPHSKDKIISVSNLGNLGWKSLEGAFEGTSGLTTFAVGTGSETDDSLSFANMFKNSGVTTINLSGIDTSAATNLEGMFYGAAALTSVPANLISIASAQSLASMFEGSTAITSLDLSSWNTSLVTDISSMFRGMSSLTTLNTSGWDTSNVENMAHLFTNATTLNPDVSTFSFAKITDGTDMFAGTAFNTAHYDAFLARASATVTTNTNVPLGVIPTSYTYNSTNAMLKYQLTSSNEKGWDIQDTPGASDGIMLTYSLTAGTGQLIRIPVLSEATGWKGEIGTASSNTYQNNFEVFINGVSVGWFTNRDAPAGAWVHNAWYQVTGGVHTLRSETPASPFINISYDVPADGEYSVEIRGQAEKLSYDGLCPNTLVAVPSLGQTGLRTLTGALENCSGLQWVGHGDISQVITIAGFINGCNNIVFVDVRDWDVRNVVDAAYAFRQNLVLENLDLSKWQTPSLVTMAAMFDYSPNLDPDLSNFDFSKIRVDYNNTWENRRSLSGFVSNTNISSENYGKLLNRLVDPTYGLQFSAPADVNHYLKMSLGQIGLGANKTKRPASACAAFATLNNLFSTRPEYDNTTWGLTIDDGGMVDGESCPP